MRVVDASVGRLWGRRVGSITVGVRCLTDSRSACMVKPENFREMGAVIAKKFNWVAVIVSVTMVLALAVAGSANAQGSSPTPASPQTPAAQAPAQNSPAPAGKTPSPAAA